MEIIVGRRGNQKLAITDTSVSREHCVLTEQPDGTFILENRSQNGTFVDGQEVVRTVVRRNTELQLGDSYRAKVADLLGLEPEYSLRALTLIHGDYQQTLDDIRRAQKKVQNLRTGAPIFTMASGVLSFVKPGAGIPLVIVGLCLSAYGWYKSNKDTSDEQRRAALDRFQENYVCPNPKCRHTLSQPPRVLLINKTCPYCKCKFTE